MAFVPPPFTVYVNRERVLKLRAGERTYLRVVALILIALGCVFVAVAGIIIVNLPGNPALSSPVFIVVTVVNLGIGPLAIWRGIRSLRSTARRSDYWQSKDLPDVAFRLDQEGITLFVPEYDRDVTVPWASVRSLEPGVLSIDFHVAPGFFPEHYRDRIDYGSAALGADMPTIRAAARALSGRDL